MDMKIARQLGMCSGVKRALKILQEALDQCSGEILYVYNEIVHNNFIINELQQKNVRFVKSVDEIPDGALTVFSAHGVSRHVEQAAKQKKLRVFDATCLLVKKNHRAVEKAFADGRRIVFIGKKSHPECIGTVGRICENACFVVENESDVENLPHLEEPSVCVVQTTLAVSDVAKTVSALQRKYPQIKNFGGICFATSERQSAVRELALDCDLILVAGSYASSNSCRLVQIAGECGIDAKLVDNIADITDFDFSSYKCVGISAGASTPQRQIDELIDFIRAK